MPFALAVQENWAFAVDVESVTVLNGLPEQIVCDAGEKETVGEGLMVTSTLKEVPVQREVVDGVTT